MIFKPSKTYILSGLILVSLLFSCVDMHKSGGDNKKLLKYVKTVKKKKLKERTKIWDSLLGNEDLSDYDLATVYFHQGIDKSIESNYNEAIESYTKALKIFKKKKDELMMAKTYINIGIANSLQGRESLAIENVFKGFELAKKLNDKETISQAYTELAHIYYLFGDKEKAIDFLQKSLLIDKQLKDSLGIAGTFINMSVIYYEQKKYNEAMQYALKAQEINTLKKDDISMLYGYGNLGRISWHLHKDFNEAMQYNYKALKIMKDNHIELPDIYENLAEIYTHNNELDSAAYYIQKALQCNIENVSTKLKYYNKLLFIELKEGNTEEALRLVKLKDSLIEIREKHDQMEVKRSLENNLNYLVNQKQLEQVKQLNKKNRIIFIFIIVVFLLGILISYQLNRFDKLKHKQEKFVLEQKILRSQMNPHFIFNVLSSIQSTLIENDPMKSATYLSKFAQLIRQNFDFVQKSTISLKDELNMIKNYIETQKFRYKDKFDYEIILDDKINQSTIQIPPMILQPFVENAIEHGFKNIDYKGLLQIVITDNDDKICFEIIDNGKGFKGEKKDEKEHALDIFKRRLEILGKEEIDSFKVITLEKGTKFVFCLTKKQKYTHKQYNK